MPLNLSCGRTERGEEMTNRDFVLKWAHLGRGRNPRHRHILHEERCLAKEHVEEIWAAQECKNAELPDLNGQPTLQVAERYATGRPR